MQLIDTHAHLYAKEFEEDRKEVIEKAIALGITQFFLPNIDSSSIPALLGLSVLYPKNCFPMMGLHPCSVNEDYESELNIVEQWLSEKRFCAIGEIGIDLYWDKTFFQQQQIAFRKQIEWAKKCHLPIIIHSRNSFEEVMEIVTEYNDNNLKGIFHCFSGNREEAERVIALRGFKLGIGGVVTFKNSGLDKVVEGIDMKHMVLETDAPYLAPVPHRGKRNESSYLLLIAQKIAAIKNISVEEVATITTQNAQDLLVPRN